MRQVLLLFVLLGALLPVQAQSTHTVDGMVCESSQYSEGECWMQGLPGATITFTSAGLVGGVGAETYSQQTDKSGSFYFGDIPEGTYTVAVTREGFEDTSTSVTVPTDFLAIQMPGKTVTTTIAIEGEGPVANADIYIDGENAGTELRTGSNGQASTDIVSGWYYIYASAKNHYEVHQQLLISNSDVHTVFIEPYPPQSSKVTGKITDQFGNGVAGVTVTSNGYYGYPEPRPMKPAEDPEYGYAEESAPYYCCDNRGSTATSGPDGRYEIALSSGYFNLEFHLDGYSRASANGEVKEDSTVTRDVVMKKFPDKDAKISGKITDGSGNALKFVSLDIQNVEFGQLSCGGYDEPGGYDRGCDVTVKSDGTFSGTVMPGYTIIRAYYQDWLACTESQDSDGSFRRECGPQYFSYVRTIVLESGDNTVNIQLAKRPSPDATVRGYVVDMDTQKAISNARVEFRNEATYGYGFAETDQDGSFAVKLVSGYHHVTVWANGYLQWEGTLRLASGAEASYDIFLMAGENQYYGCCYAFEGDVSMAYAEGSPSSMPTSPSADGDESNLQDRSFTSEEGENVQDLNGGLGPYDAEKRANFQATGDDEFVQAASDKGSPGLPWIAALALLGAIALMRRRA